MTQSEAKKIALKTVKETQWVGEVTHDTIQKCLDAISFFHSMNSGLYKPKAGRLIGIHGVFMLNEDGSLNVESRIIKVDDNTYKIEHLSNAGYKAFENKFIEIIES